MPLRARVVNAFRSLLRRRELDRELDEELKSALAMLEAEKIRAGMSPREAHRRACIEFGGLEQVKQEVRDQRPGSGIGSVVQDVLYALRGFRRNPGFATVAVLILAVGIGASTALYSNIHSVLVRGLPFPEADRLVVGLTTRNGEMTGPVSRVDYFDYRASSHSFAALAALADFTVLQTTTDGGRAELVESVYSTWNLFRTLGVEPVAGRGFLLEEETPGNDAVAVITYGLAQRRFGGAAEAVGASLHLDGTQLTVIGVLPESFRFRYPADVWRPITTEGPYDASRGSHSHFVVGRLGSGVSLEQAQSDVESISAGLAAQFPESNAGKGFVLRSLQAHLVRDARLGLLLLMTTTLLVLLIACANVGGLLLARGEQRLAELSLRSSLGASRPRLIRQLLTESITLALIAGTLGVGLAYLAHDALVGVLPVRALGVDSPRMSTLALGFALGISMVTGLITGVVPALRTTEERPAGALRSGIRISSGLASSRLRGGLVVGQVALSVVLLVGSGLVIRSLARLSHAELGFDSNSLLTGQIKLQEADYPEDSRWHFFSSFLEEVEGLPGVESATLINRLPILSPWQDWSIWRADQAPPLPDDDFSAMARWVSSGYFQTMGMPVIAGRAIATTDVRGGPDVIVLSESTAKVLFGDADPLGRHVRIGWPDRSFEVVGVVADARVNRIRGDPDPVAYMAAAQLAPPRMHIAIRTVGDPMRMVGPIEALLRRKDPNVVLAFPASMSSILDEQLADFRIVVISLTMFSCLALALAGIGLYGVLAYNVSQRRNEMGIRLALGASNSNILIFVLRRGLTLALGGLILGACVALPATFLMRQLLYDTRPIDPTAYVAAVVFMSAVAAFSSFMPAWRATRVDVLQALRSD